jgi:hypothetical protein
MSRINITDPTILCPRIDDQHIESFWYYGKKIASCGNWYIESSGEIRVFFDGEIYKNEAAVKEALYRNLTDKDLLDLEFDSSNWFEISQGCQKDERIIEHTYDEAITALKTRSKC